MAIVDRLASDVVSHVERIVGPLDGASALVYDDPDDGFVCGSTGQPPIPFPPRGNVASIRDLVAGGALEPELITYLNEATKRGLSVERFLEDPAGTAKELGIPLSERAAGDLRRLAPSNASEIADPVEREVITYFHAVVRDGKVQSAIPSLERRLQTLDSQQLETTLQLTSTGWEAEQFSLDE